LLIQKNRTKTFFHENLSPNSEIINLLIQKNRVDILASSECNTPPYYHVLKVIVRKVSNKYFFQLFIEVYQVVPSEQHLNLG